MDSLFENKSAPVIICPIRKTEEYTVTGDMILPEFCPDVASVLRCTVTPCIQNRQWSGEQLLIDGTAMIRVLYLDEERRCVRQAEFPQPISAAIDMGKTTTGETVWIDWTPQFAVCRATGPRRLEVRGAFLIHVRADCRQTFMTELPSADDGLILQTEKAILTGSKETGEKIVHIEETVDFPAGVEAVEMLLDGSCHAVITECKLLGDKAIIKGQIKVHRLYTDDPAAGTTAVTDHVLAFSQIVDMDDADENDPCFTHALILDEDIRCSSDPDGKNPVLQIKLKVLVQVFLYQTKEIETVKDAFHCCYPVTVDTREQPVTVMTGIVQKPIPLVLHTDLPAENIREVLDIRLGILPNPAVRKENGLQFSARLNIGMLVRDDRGLIGYFERQEDLSDDLEMNGCAADVHVALNSLQYTVNGGKIEIRAELNLTAIGWIETVLRSIGAVTADTDHPYPAEPSALKIYYAEAGEKVFDIARYCHASPQIIREENALDDETVKAPTPLLIPMG